jgi:hypothetical protein
MANQTIHLKEAKEACEKILAFLSLMDFHMSLVTDEANMR